MKLNKNNLRQIILEELQDALKEAEKTDTNVNQVPDNTEIINLLSKVLKELRILNWITAKTAEVYFAPVQRTGAGGPAGLGE